MDKRMVIIMMSVSVDLNLVFVPKMLVKNYDLGYKFY